VTPKPTSWQTKAVYHGLSQGFIGWLRNKDFWSGFVAGVVGHGVGHSLDASGISSMYARAAIASGAAAITAGATGGDAAAAALFAVIVHLYNAEGGSQTSEQKSSKFGELLAEFNGRVVTWDQDTGLFSIYQDGELLYSDWGYSGGNLGDNLEGVNNTDFQSLTNIGPIVKGVYMVGSAGRMDSGAKGFRLHPSPVQKMFGRDGFWVHGGSSNLLIPGGEVICLRGLYLRCINMLRLALIIILFFPEVGAAESIKFNWEVLPNVEIGKFRSDNFSNLNVGSCSLSECLSGNIFYPKVLSRVRISKLEIKIIKMISGVDTALELQNKIEKSDDFTKFGDENSNCNKYGRDKEHSSPQSFSMTNEGFSLIYVGYVSNIDWPFNEAEIVEFCDKDIVFARVISF
jgi:hypothetical protein